MFENFPATWNEPKQLNQKEYDFEVLREEELENMQARIEQALTLNAKKSDWLNYCLILACFTPVVALLIWSI